MEILRRYKHLFWIPVYGIFYLAAFSYLEKTVTHGYHLIHMPADDLIPFCEYFVVPYLLWFAYIAVGVIYFGVIGQEKKEYYQLIINLGIGMTLFLVISYLYPNGQNLRPREFAHDNLFTALVQYVYSIDTPTNIFPSIHVYNSVAVATAFERSAGMKKHRGWRAASTTLAVLIILSTMFLKQHSVSDVCCALILNLGTYMLLYRQADTRYARRAARRRKLKARMNRI